MVISKFFLDGDFEVNMRRALLGEISSRTCTRELVYRGSGFHLKSPSPHRQARRIFAGGNGCCSGGSRRFALFRTFRSTGCRCCSLPEANRPLLPDTSSQAQTGPGRPCLSPGTLRRDPPWLRSASRSSLASSTRPSCPRCFHLPTTGSCLPFETTGITACSCP